PLDFGIIHYASDTPYTQARTLGARGLSYYGMDSTYASSLAIVRRVLALEGGLDAPQGVAVLGCPKCSTRLRSRSMSAVMERDDIEPVANETLDRFLTGTFTVVPF